jgi:hypothetical protein
MCKYPTHLKSVIKIADCKPAEESATLQHVQVSNALQYGAIALITASIVGFNYLPKQHKDKAIAVGGAISVALPIATRLVNRFIRQGRLEVGDLLTPLGTTGPTESADAVKRVILNQAQAIAFEKVRPFVEGGVGISDLVKVYEPNSELLQRPNPTQGMTPEQLEGVLDRKLKAIAPIPATLEAKVDKTLVAPSGSNINLLEAI